MTRNRRQVSTYVRPEVSNAISELSEIWGLTVSQTVQILVKWGAYRLAIEETIQRIEVGGSELYEAMQSGKSPEGPIEMSLPVDEATKCALRAQLAELRGLLGA